MLLRPIDTLPGLVIFKYFSSTFCYCIEDTLIALETATVIQRTSISIGPYNPGIPNFSSISHTPNTLDNTTATVIQGVWNNVNRSMGSHGYPDFLPP